MAIAAFARRQEGSGVIGVDVQRIRRALGLRAEPQPDLPEDDARREGLPRDALRRFEALLRRELERSQIERTGNLPPLRDRSGSSTVRCRPGPSRTLRPSTAWSPSSGAGSRHRACRRAATRRHAHVDVRRTMRASLQTGGVPVELKFRPRRPKRPEIYVLCDVSTSVTSASVFFLSVLHALHDTFRKMRSFVFIERISEVTDIFERERNFKTVSERISGDAGVADISGYTDYGRVWSEFLDTGGRRTAPAATVIVLGDARTNGRDPRADYFAQIAARAGRLLAEPRAAPLLELRRLGDRRLRAVLHGFRVLDDLAARGLRPRPDTTGHRRRQLASAPLKERLTAPVNTSPRRGLLTAVCLACALALTACGAKQDVIRARSTKPFTVALDFFPNADHAAIYSAIAHGDFRAVGLDVRPVAPPTPSAPLSLLESGRADMAISYEPEVLLARDKGAKIVSIAALVQRPLTSIISINHSITKVSELAAGRSAPPGIPYQSAELRHAALAHAGVDPASVKEINVRVRPLAGDALRPR